MIKIFSLDLPSTVHNGSSLQLIPKIFPISDPVLVAAAYSPEFLSQSFEKKERWRSSSRRILLFGVFEIPLEILSAILIILQPIGLHSCCTPFLINANYLFASIAPAIDEISASLNVHKIHRSKGFIGESFKGAQKDPSTQHQAASFIKYLETSLFWIGFPWVLTLSLLLIKKLFSYSCQILISLWPGNNCQNNGCLFRPIPMDPLHQSDLCSSESFLFFYRSRIFHLFNNRMRKHSKRAYI